MRLSVKEIDSLALPAGKSDHIEWDDELGGFGLRLREGRLASLGLPIQTW